MAQNGAPSINTHTTENESLKNVSPGCSRNVVETSTTLSLWCTM